MVNVHRMALAVAEGAESVPDTTVRLRRIAELEEARKALSAQDELTTARNLGSRLARVADRLKNLRVSTAAAP
jgi:hypothetical protein